MAHQGDLQLHCILLHAEVKLFFSILCTCMSDNVQVPGDRLQPGRQQGVFYFLFDLEFGSNTGAQAFPMSAESRAHVEAAEDCSRKTRHSLSSVLKGGSQTISSWAGVFSADTGFISPVIWPIRPQSELRWDVRRSLFTNFLSLPEESKRRSTPRLIRNS